MRLGSAPQLPPVERLPSLRRLAWARAVLAGA